MVKIELVRDRCSMGRYIKGENDIAETYENADQAVKGMLKYIEK